MEPDVNKRFLMRSVMRKCFPAVATIAVACAIGIPTWRSYDRESKANPSIAAKVDKLYSQYKFFGSGEYSPLWVCEDGTFQRECPDGVSRYVFNNLHDGITFLVYLPVQPETEVFYSRDFNGDGINKYDTAMTVSPKEYASFNATYEKHLDKLISILEQKSPVPTAFKYPRRY